MSSQTGTRPDYSSTSRDRRWAPTLRLTRCERVVDGLAVAPELLADAGVGVPVEVEREHAGLEVGEHGGQARDQRAQLLGGDHLVDRVAAPGPGSISSSVGSLSAAPAGVEENEM